ncbi:MAG: calcium-binding protein, partial [Clostridia bacterium]|nr:calcium-binding protein [Clostridia bacterium]
ARVDGVSIGALTVGVSETSITLTPTVTASIGANSIVVAGTQLLSNDPVLTFSSAAILSGGPALTFDNTSAHMATGTPLTLAPGTENGGTISRVSGSFISDGFLPGDYVYVTGTPGALNDNVYLILDVTADTLTLDAAHASIAVGQTGVTQASVYTDKPASITRSSGSWTTDGFAGGQIIEVTGSTANDGYFLVWGIDPNDAKILYLLAGSEISDEITAAGQVMITADTPDRIYRNSGNWADDGFASGQAIQVANTGLNDGDYTVAAISEDGRYLVLTSDANFQTESTTDAALMILASTITHLLEDDQIETETIYNLSSLSVHAWLLKPASPEYTAKAIANASSGSLIGDSATTVTISNTSSTQALVGNGTTLVAAAIATVDAYSYANLLGLGDSLSFGFVTIGGNTVSVTTHDTTQATLGSETRVIAGQFALTAFGEHQTFAKSIAGGGGIGNFQAARASTSNTSLTEATIAIDSALHVDELRVIAEHQALFNTQVDSTSAALLGVSGATGSNSQTATVQASLGNQVTVEAHNLLVRALNTTFKDALPSNACHAQSGSGGAIDAPAAQSISTISHQTTISIGEGARLSVVGDPYAPGALSLNALNTVFARDRVKLESYGAISVAKAQSIIQATALQAAVNVARDAHLASVGDIDLSARTVADIDTNVYVLTGGGAGAAQGRSAATANATNTIAIGENSLLFAEGNIHLLAGRNSSDQVNVFSLKARTNLYNYTGFPVSTRPEADAILNQTNTITILSGALLETVRDANLLTDSGITILIGDGYGKDFYRDAIGAEIRYEKSDIFNHSTVRIDGTVRVGIRNKQRLIIGSDGSVEEQSTGVTFSRSVERLGNLLLQEITRLQNLIRQYAGTTAGAAFKAELEFRLADIASQGYTIVRDGQGNVIYIDGEVYVDVITVNDIWAQSGTINVSGDNLVGSGFLRAPSDAEIVIENKSPAFLTLRRLTIPSREGGGLVINHITVTGASLAEILAQINDLNLNATALFSQVELSATSTAPQIDIRNTYNSSGRDPDITLMGSISNVGVVGRPGTVYIASTGGVNSRADINAGTLDIHASGNFVQSYVDTYYNVGGEPLIQWGSVSRPRENDTKWRLANKLPVRTYPGGYSAAEVTSIEAFIDSLLARSATTDPSLSELRAANIFIAARYLNINGLIEAGHANQSITLGDAIALKIATYKARGTLTRSYLDYPLIQQANLKFYYDPVNDRILLDDVDVYGGYIELFGQILNTGTGKIVALDGFGTINVDNQTGYSLTLQSLNTGVGSHGTVKITDTSKKTTIGGVDYFLATLYKRTYDPSSGSYQIETTEWYTNIDQPAAPNKSPVSGSATEYWPTSGYRYVYVTGQNAVTRETYVYARSTWAGIDWLAKDPGSLYSYNRITYGNPVQLDNGEYLVYQPDNVIHDYLYWYQSIATAGKELIYTNTWVERGGFLNLKKTYWTTLIYETGSRDVHYHSVRADYPIQIEFAGGLEGFINIQTTGDLILEGAIKNEKGQTSLTAAGSIEQVSDSKILTRALTLSAGTGIGNNLPILVELKGGRLITSTTIGTIQVRDVAGSLVIDQIHSSGTIILTSQASIQPYSPDSLISGGTVILQAPHGSIGTNGGLRIDTGAASIQAYAYGDIHLIEVEGDLAVISVISETGNVRLDVLTGGLTDGNPTTETDAAGLEIRDQVTEGELLQIWSDQQITGSGDHSNLYTASQVSQLIMASQSKTLTDTKTRLEIVNISGRQVQLMTAGGIGQTNDYQFEFVDGLVQLNDQARILLAAAERGTLAFTDANGQTVDPASGDLKYLVIHFGEDVDLIATETLTVSAGGPIDLYSPTEINLRSFSGGDSRIRSDGAILNSQTGSGPVLTSNSLILEAASGTIGTIAKPLTLTMQDPDQDILTMRSHGRIDLNSLASGTSSGALNLDYLYTTDTIRLQAAGYIRDNRNDPFVNLTAEALTVLAASFGTSANPVEIELPESGLTDIATIAGGIYLTELTGNLNLAQISTSTGDVNLKTQGSILDGRAGAFSALTLIAGHSIRLVAVDGMLGTMANHLEFDTANGGSGLLHTTSSGDQFLDETTAGLVLGLLTSTTGRIFLVSPDSISNGQDSGSNIVASWLQFESGGSAGSASRPLQTQITRLAGTASGSIWLANTGALTIGQIPDGQDTLSATTGLILLTVQSPLTLEGHLAAQGDITLWTKDHAGASDSIQVQSTATVTSGAAILLLAGDSIDLQAGSQITAATSLTLFGDFSGLAPAVSAYDLALDADLGTGASILVRNTLATPMISIFGGRDNDTFEITVLTLASDVRLHGGNGDDAITINQLPSLTSEFSGQQDRVTLDGENGSDTYTIHINGQASVHHLITIADSGTDTVPQTITSGTGYDQIFVNGTGQADSLLLRQTFVAVLHALAAGGIEFTEQFERINYDDRIEWLTITTGDGDDRVFSDDNSAQTTIYGGLGDDFFQIGQMFGSPRDDGAQVDPGDEFATVHTTKGYLSAGNTHQMLLYGNDGNDLFSVYANLAELRLEGNDGNDKFILRAFALADPDDPAQALMNVDAGTGEDYIEYNINAKVTINGGDGYDTVIAVGSEFADVFIVTRDGITGAGLNIVIEGAEEAFEAYGMEGDDIFYVQSTRENMVTRLVGGLGSDLFVLMGDVTVKVVTSAIVGPVVDHLLSAIQGPIYLEGYDYDGAPDFTLRPGIGLPHELSPDLPSNEMTVDENQMTDQLFAFNDDDGSGQTGSLTVFGEGANAPSNLSGLGMGDDWSVNEGTPADPIWVTYHGGVTFTNLEVAEILLGYGNDRFTIHETVATTLIAVHGGGGDDLVTILSSQGPLVIYGDTSDDGIRYSSANDGEPHANGHVFSNPGNDTIDASASSGSLAVSGGTGDDTITGSQASDHLAGGSGQDTLAGESGDDILYGDSTFTVDLIARTVTVITTGASSSDTLHGGFGHDILLGDHGQVTQTGLLSGTQRVDNTSGIIAVASVNPASGTDDTLNGDAGDDILIGGTGADTIHGHDGHDLLLGDHGSLATADLAPAGAHTANTRYRTLTGETLYDADGYPLIAGSAPINPDGQVFWACLTITLNHDGDGGNDSIFGDAGHDLIFGQDGNDILDGGEGDDTIEGGAGDDTLCGGFGQDDLIGGSSNLFGYSSSSDRSDGSDTIYGDDGNDTNRNTFGYDTGETAPDNIHSANADVILGDNGNIFRIVDESGHYLTFAYDTAAYYPGDLRIRVRVVQLLDYITGGPDYSPDALNDLGAADTIHGESGNDVIYGMTGDDILYGEGQDDDLIGGWGHDWISGGTGDDGILGDDGHLYTSRHGTAEPLYGIEATQETYIEGTKTLTATVNVTGILNKTALLTPLNLSPNGGADVFFDPAYADDILYGGLGNDFIHGGSGDDAISGTEALEQYYADPFNPGDVLGYDPDTTLFAAYNPKAPMARVYVDETGAFVTSGGTEFILNFASGEVEWDGHDRIFGDLGNDWLVGGPGQDQLFGGLGNDLLNGDDDHDPWTANTEVDVPPTDQPATYYDDIIFGGGGRDILIASSTGDALVDWVGEFNTYVVPTSKFGPGTIIRFSNASIVQFLVDLALSSGLDKTAGRSVLTADPARYFEPYGELGIVLNGDPFSSDQNGAPRDPQPGNKGGVKK